MHDLNPNPPGDARQATPVTRVMRLAPRSANDRRSLDRQSNSLARVCGLLEGRPELTRRSELVPLTLLLLQRCTVCAACRGAVTTPRQRPRRIAPRKQWLSAGRGGSFYESWRMESRTCCAPVIGAHAAQLDQPNGRATTGLARSRYVRTDHAPAPDARGGDGRTGRRRTWRASHQLPSIRHT